MVQGGGFTAQMMQKPTHDPIKNEAENGLHNVRGTIAMARTSDVNSATSQFFINVKDNEMLDHGVRDFGYAVFGKVVKGMDVVDTIVNSQTTNKGGMQNVPVDPILIKSVKVVN
jgi:peptidyl-prolyl cis-trans isomerase A (cyclophilin A)